MISGQIDSLLARFSARPNLLDRGHGLKTHMVSTPVGAVRVSDTGTEKPCVVIVPDGPNVIEHYQELIEILSPSLRVVCFDMPGFGHSLPSGSYTHSLDQGARAVLGVLDSLNIESASLAFSCANGLYAIRAAYLAPQRIRSLVLAQTPSLASMHAWTKVIPWPLPVPVIGQFVAWLARKNFARIWYPRALPRSTDAEPFTQKAMNAFATGSCFCLAGVVQGLCREHSNALKQISTPCTMVWGDQDRSHRKTDPKSVLSSVPKANIVYFEDCGHFPDIEQPKRYAALLLDQAKKYA